MSAEIVSNENGIVTASISGKLTRAELAAAQKAIADLIRQSGPVRVLILLDGFEGWAKSGDWGDLSFQVEHDPYIVKMALVGDRKWEGLALMFTGKGVRSVPIEYFAPGEADRARAWLNEG